jgi:hypothetical protein
MRRSEYMALYGELLKEAEEKVADMNPALLHTLLVGGGLAAGAVPTALVMNQLAEKKRLATRNKAFGAGVATGVAAPHLLKGVFTIAKRLGLMPEEQPLYAGGMQ